jgi:hypothetical protein
VKSFFNARKDRRLRQRPRVGVVEEEVVEAEVEEKAMAVGVAVSGATLSVVPCLTATSLSQKRVVHLSKAKN